MLVQGPALGIRFNISKLESGYYSFECWKIVWGALVPETIKDSQLFEGDSRATLNGAENVYCIAISNREIQLLNCARRALMSSEAFCRVSASPNFVDESALSSEPLVEGGSVDPTGQISGASPVAKPAWEDLCRGAGGSKSAPRPVRTGQGGQEARGSTLSTTSKMDGSIFAAFKEELFDLEMERHRGIISPEEYQRAKAALDCLIGRLVKRHS